MRKALPEVLETVGRHHREELLFRVALELEPARRAGLRIGKKWSTIPRSGRPRQLYTGATERTCVPMEARS
jgi:hypothetical protein